MGECDSVGGGGCGSDNDGDNDGNDGHYSARTK